MKAAFLAVALAACTVQTPEPVYVPTAQQGAAARDCSGNDSLQIVDETIDSLNVHGNCAVFIDRSRIVGAFDIHGNAHVTVENSTIDGPVDLHGNATLTTSGSTYAGGINRHGNAALDDRGGNAF